MLHLISFFFFFNDTATTEIYPLSLHDALPISELLAQRYAGATITGIDNSQAMLATARQHLPEARFTLADIASWTPAPDRKSTRLNSSHVRISYAVFCLKKKKKKKAL